MTTLSVVQSYTDDQRRLAKAAVQRYGLRAAERVLTDAWPRGPTQKTLISWSHDDDIVVTDADAEFWQDADEARKRVLQAEIATRIPSMLGAIDTLLENPNQHAGKVQNLAIATGIFYDKIVPPTQKGGISFGDNATVQLNVIAPPQHDGEARRIRPVESHVVEDSDGVRG